LYSHSLFKQLSMTPFKAGEPYGYTLFLHFLLPTNIGLLDSCWENNITIQSRWENSNENLRLWSWAPWVKVTKINCDIGMHEILLGQILAKLFSSTGSLRFAWATLAIYTRCKNHKPNDNMSSCESLRSKFDFDGSSGGWPSNAGFEFVNRNHMEEPAKNYVTRCGCQEGTKTKLPWIWM